MAPSAAVFRQAVAPLALIFMALPAVVGGQDRPTPEAMTIFTLVQELRHQGFTCPDGTAYPPNRRPFEWDCRLWRAARAWSQRMAAENFIAHERDGSTPCTRTEAEGYPHMRGCGENVAGGNDDPAKVVEQWKTSNAHCRNMLDPGFTQFGVGWGVNLETEYRYYWTQDFGSWWKAPDQSCIGGAAAPSTPGCADIDTFNCRQYQQKGFCAYSPHVRERCKETCGLCGVEAPKPGGCQDDPWAGCDVYEARGSCKNSASVREQCKKTCGMCGPDAPPLDCLDEPNNPCEQYRQAGECETSTTVKADCRLTCGFCGAAAQRRLLRLDTNLHI